MNELFKVVLSLSLSGSLLILLLFALKPAYRERFGKRWQYYIWLVVLLRLVLPFSPEINLMGSLFPQIERAVTEKITAMPDNSELNADSFRGSLSEPAAEPAYDDPARSLSVDGQPIQTSEPFSIRDFLWIIWMVGALVWMVHKITVYRSFAQYVKAGNEEVSDPDILNMLSDLCEQAGVKTRVELSVNPLISSPLLMGLFRPHIVLPDISPNKEELRYILLHELTHCRLRDTHYKWLVQAVLCLHWFNPIVHLAVREINKACELACDEAVIQSLDADGRKVYGAALLSVLDAPGKYKQSVAAVTLGENAAQLKERLELIMRYNGKSKWRALAVLCTLLFISMGAMTGVYASASGIIPEPITPPANVALTVQPPAISPESRIVTETRTVSKTETVTIKPNITGGSVVLEDGLKITALDIRPSIGNLTIKRGEQYKIEVGSKLTEHAIYEVKDGVLRYSDDYAGKQIEANNTNVGYNIFITLPGGSAYDNVTVSNGFGPVTIEDIEAGSASIGSAFGEGKLSGIKAGALDVHFNFGAITAKDCSASGAISIKSEFGSLTLDTVQAKSLTTDTQSGGIEMRNCTIDGAVICKSQLGGYTIDGLKARSLSVDNQTGGLTVRQSTISGGMNIAIASGGTEITGDIKGDISIEKGLGGFSLTLTGSKRNDYHVTAIKTSFGENPVISSNIKIDGKSYPYDYEDTNANALYTLTISSSEGFGEDVSVNFGAK